MRQLRFNVEATPWQEQPLKKVALVCDGTHQTPVYTEEGVRFVSVEDINNIGASAKFISKEDYENNFKVKPEIGDILMTRIGDVGSCALVKDTPLAYYVSLTLIKCNDSVSSEFLKYFLESRYFQKELYRRMIHAAFPKKINLTEIGECLVRIPGSGEQQKIAAFFAALDEKIACESKRVEKIKLIKKYYLWKIFNEEVHFRNSTSWKETNFGEVSTFLNGRAYAQDELLNKGKYLVLRVGNFFTNSEYYYSDLELDDDKYANDGDLLYAWSASFGPRIWHGGKVIYHYHIWKVVPKNIDKNFLFYALQYDVERVKGELNGGTMSHLTKSAIEGRVLKIPCEKEQEEIGEFLKLLDEKIVLASRRLEVLVRQRKSFIQRMFI